MIKTVIDIFLNINLYGVYSIFAFESWFKLRTVFARMESTLFDMR